MIRPPERLDDRSAVADRLIRPLRDGKPELGWSGDPDLELVYHRLGYWELWRLEAQDAHRLIAKGPVGQALTENSINQLISSLVQRDTHRSGVSHEKQLEDVIKYNDKMSKDRLTTAASTAAETLEKVYYEVSKEVGHLY